MERKSRKIQYDYLRVIAVIAIIMVHSIPAETANNRQWLFLAAILPVLLSFVGIYFMLSGLFLLDHGTENILAFYKNRLCTIVIPFGFYTGVYYIYYKVYLGEDKLSVFTHVKNWFLDWLTGSVPMAPHLWFMYVILAFYLCAPFLARMLRCMNDHELKIFLVMIFMIQSIQVYLPPLHLLTEEAFQYMIFKGWLIYFVLGYSLKRLFHNSRYLPFAAVGLAGFAVTMFQKCFTPLFTPGIHDMAPTMIGMAACIFMFFEQYADVSIPGITNAFGLVSRHSYSVYLIHYLVLGQLSTAIVEKTWIRHFYIPKILCLTALTFLISLAVSWLFDETILKLLKRIPDFIWKQGKGR
ncbi:acyltransferase [Clostridium boliviensis]|uniref:Acyltransferase n=1 Tax=Clostridium boliviensis TaxID=318465 RepID=A0ABU4GK05_9CLOT|nr:acyltransferase [Clostridium boliviensis]MDW2796602.1 acyltransferase [Clostridium boliviensis]